LTADKERSWFEPTITVVWNNGMCQIKNANKDLKNRTDSQQSQREPFLEELGPDFLPAAALLVAVFFTTLVVLPPAFVAATFLAPDLVAGLFVEIFLERTLFLELLLAVEAAVFDRDFLAVVVFEGVLAAVRLTTDLAAVRLTTDLAVDFFGVCFFSDFVAVLDLAVLFVLPTSDLDLRGVTFAFVTTVLIFFAVGSLTVFVDLRFLLDPK